MNSIVDNYIPSTFRLIRDVEYTYIHSLDFFEIVSRFQKINELLLNGLSVLMSSEISISDRELVLNILRTNGFDVVQINEDKFLIRKVINEDPIVYLLLWAIDPFISRI